MPAPGHDALIAAIEAYLASHPQAADSAEGVAQWWLGSPTPAVAMQDVERALLALAQRGVVRRAVLADGTSLYRGNRAVG